MLDYEYDSEAEWVDDDVEGEDLAASDLGGDGIEDSQSELAEESDEDGWLAGDDDEIEMMIDEGETHFQNRSLDALNEEMALKKQTTKIMGQVRRKKFVGPLVPVVKGPLWERRLGVVEVSMLEPYRIQFINGPFVLLFLCFQAPFSSHEIILRPFCCLDFIQMHEQD